MSKLSHNLLESSFFIPLEQGLKHHSFISGAQSVKFFLHSIRTRIKTFSRSYSPNPMESSFFIPLEQGLKHASNGNSVLVHAFFLHSIRTRIKTLDTYVIPQKLGSSFFIPLEQGLKPKVTIGYKPPEVGSFFIPLEQGLKQKPLRYHQVGVSSFFIPLEQGLKHVAALVDDRHIVFFLHSIRTRIKTRRREQAPSRTEVLSSFH